MNDKNFQLAEGLISPSYVRQARESRRARENLVTILLAQRRMPVKGWDELSIEMFMHEIASMDSNQFLGAAGVGEREARIFSALVSRRYFGLGHGVGRSGDIAAEQPKAAGSSLLQKLANYLTLDAMRLSGLQRMGGCIVVPLATGMALTLTMQAIRAGRPAGARYVIWPRVDQKTCLKSILAAGLIPVVLENVRDGDELQTDVTAMERKIVELGVDNITCVISTTSVFAPRAPDRVQEVAALAARFDLPHVVNNAYGLQAGSTTHQLSEACRTGRVDAIVQSTDKNFLVPVGGALIASPRADVVQAVSHLYPGRASVSAALDLLLTLLAMGSDRYQQLLAERKVRRPRAGRHRTGRAFPAPLTAPQANYAYLQQSLGDVAARHGERLLATPHNPISMGMTLSALSADRLTQLGAALFTRHVSGARVVPGSGAPKTVAPGFAFAAYGAHCDAYPVPYLTAAAALGQTREEIDLFAARLDRVLSELRGVPVRPAVAASAAPRDAPTSASPPAAAAAAATASPMPPPPTVPAARSPPAPPQAGSP